MLDTCLFRKKLFNVIKELKPSWRGEYEITDTIRLMMQKGYKIGCSIIDGMVVRHREER